MEESSENGHYELVQAEPGGSSQSTFGDDIIDTKPTWTLPPKPLLARGQVNFSQYIVISALVTAFFLAMLSILLSQIPHLLPNRDIATGSKPVLLSNGSPQRYGFLRRVTPNPISCDLINANNSAFEEVFTIDLRFQLRLSFATAKFIDVVWDLVIGQGGRLLLAWISYVVFMDGLARLMETSTVSYQLYASIVFETSSLVSTWYSLKAVSTAHGWRGRAFLAWFGIATLYVLAYSTLMSAATGYLKPSNIRYRVLNDILIPPDSDELTHCIKIHNAPAVGLDDGYIVPGPSDKELDNPKLNDTWSKYPFFNTLLMAGKGGSHQDVYSYIKANNLPSNLTRFLNLPIVQVKPDMTFWDDFSRSYSSNLTGRVGVQEIYCYENNSLPLDFEKNLECLASPFFVWGFSSVILYIILSLQFVWTLGMFAVWLDANIYSKLCRKRRRLRGSFRNALDLAEAIKEFLGDDLCAYLNSEIARQLDNSGHGLQFYSTSDSDNGISHIGISSLKGGQKFHLDEKCLYGGLGRD